MGNRSTKIVLISGLMMVQLAVSSSVYGEDVKISRDFRTIFFGKHGVTEGGLSGGYTDS